MRVELVHRADQDEKNLSNKNVIPVPRTNGSDLHQVLTLSRTANAKTGLTFDSFLPSLFFYVAEVINALKMEDDRPPMLVLMGESCWGGGPGSIKLRLLFLTGDRCS